MLSRADWHSFHHLYIVPKSQLDDHEDVCMCSFVDAAVSSQISGAPGYLYGGLLCVAAESVHTMKDYFSCHVH